MSDLLALLATHGVEHSLDHHHSRPGWVQLRDCPFCHSSNYHLGLRLDLSRAACYKCGGKSVRGVLRALEAIPRAEAGKLLGSGDRYLSVDPEKVFGGYKEPAGIGDLEGMHLRYLRQRGLDPEYCKTVWGMRGLGPFAEYPRRVFLPIAYRTKYVSWTTRAVDPDATLRYLTAKAEQKSMDEKKLLYGMDMVKHTVIVVEGPFDAINVGPGAAATLGIAYTFAQISRIAAVPRRCIVFDGSPDAQRRAEALCEQLASFPGDTLRIVLDADDPGSASKSEIALLRKTVGL